MRVLVTGHDGYVGRRLVPLLIERGHKVVGLDTRLYEGWTLEPDDSDGVHSLRIDVRDVQAAGLSTFDAVVHLAALSNDPLSSLRPDTTYEINHRAAVRLAELARQAGVTRFLLASSCSVYGAAGDDIVDEDAPVAPLTPYARSKAMAEEGVAELVDDGFSPTLLRCATAYGLSPRLRGDLVVNNLVGYAVATGEVRVTSDGTPWRPLVHVEDIARAFAATLEAPSEAVRGRVLNVGREGENYRVAEIAEVVAAAVPGSRVAYARLGGPDARSYRVSFARIAAAVPSWRPRWSLYEGVAELVDVFQRRALTVHDLEGPRLQRLRKVEERIAEGTLDASLRPVPRARAVLASS